LREIVRAQGKNLAAVVMEPARSIEPQPGFLEGVRALCDESGARLMFDEVSSGFRLHRGGAHIKYGIVPDLAIFAKALGNGHPIAAVLGEEATMRAAQHSFISSTNWTESVGPTAALATLKILRENDVPSHVARIAELVRCGLTALAREYDVPFKVGGLPALTTFGFDHRENAALLTLWTSLMLERGFLTSSAFYPTYVHTAEHVEAFVAAAQSIFPVMGEAIDKDEIGGSLNMPVKHSGFARLN
jgi:glutamate-1-semialdehyde 2,1-aminomutase